jgi:hypothetical protein
MRWHPRSGTDGTDFVRRARPKLELTLSKRRLSVTRMTVEQRGDFPEQEFHARMKAAGAGQKLSDPQI